MLTPEYKVVFEPNFRPKFIGTFIHNQRPLSKHDLYVDLKNKTFRNVWSNYNRYYRDDHDDNNNIIIKRTRFCDIEDKRDWLCRYFGQEVYYILRKVVLENRCPCKC